MRHILLLVTFAGLALCTACSSSGEGEGESESGDMELHGLSPVAKNGGETCREAVPLHGAEGMVAGDLTGAANDLRPAAVGWCTGRTGSSSGNDLFYSMRVPPRSAVRLKMDTETVDYPVLYALRTCDVVQDACIVGSNRAKPPQPFTPKAHAEMLVKNPTSSDLPIIVVTDLYFQNVGTPFTLSWETLPLVTLPTGAICDVASQTSVCDKAAGKSCSVSSVDPVVHTCVTPVTLAEGAPCDRRMQSKVCAAGAGLTCADPDGDSVFNCVELKTCPYYGCP